MSSITDYRFTQNKNNLFQNVRSLHLHTDDVNIFVETKLCLSVRDETYQLSGFTRYRNDFNQSSIGTSYGTALFKKKSLDCIEIPYRLNFNYAEITVMLLSYPTPNIHVVGILNIQTKVQEQTENENLNKVIRYGLCKPKHN